MLTTPASRPLPSMMWPFRSSVILPRADDEAVAVAVDQVVQDLDALRRGPRRRRPSRATGAGMISQTYCVTSRVAVHVGGAQVERVHADGEARVRLRRGARGEGRVAPSSAHSKVVPRSLDENSNGRVRLDRREVRPGVERRLRRRAGAAPGRSTRRAAPASGRRCRRCRPRAPRRCARPAAARSSYSLGRQARVRRRLPSIEHWNVDGARVVGAGEAERRDRVRARVRRRVGEDRVRRDRVGLRDRRRPRSG